MIPKSVTYKFKSKSGLRFGIEFEFIGFEIPKGDWRKSKVFASTLLLSNEPIATGPVYYNLPNSKNLAKLARECEEYIKLRR